jgi:predicted nuclease with RNAse H fold
MIFAGIDVGKKCKMAIIDEKKLIYAGDYEIENISNAFAAGIDAPLTLPQNGMFRECERKLLKLGIRLFPSGAPFFRKTAILGMEIAENLRKMGLKVYEVYPYASRVLLNIAPKAKKRKREGLQEIILSLSRYIETPELSHDEVDAVISALTVREFVLGRGSSVEGEGEIILPRVVE